MRHRFIASLLALLWLPILTAQEPDHVNSNGDGIDTPGERSAFKTKLQLEQVNNTADTAKPISTATQAALDAKASTASLAAKAGTSGEGIDNGDKRASFLSALEVKNPTFKNYPVLARYRENTAASGGTVTAILFNGDSMIGTAEQRLRAQVQTRMGISGYLWLTHARNANAELEQDACVKWISGDTTKLDSASDEVTLALDGAFPVEGDTIKVYYLIQPSGGSFDIQLSENGGAFTKEGSTVSTSGTLAGGVVSISKPAGSKWRCNYKIKCVGVTGTVNIIGGGIWDTRRQGARYGSIANGSNLINNIDNASTTAAAIVNPILAAMAPNIIVLSHLDGASNVNAFQATYQDKLITATTSGGAPVPSVIVVGPPVGFDATVDAAASAQAEAQLGLAMSRGDAFFDNRTWAGTPTQAVARGFLPGGPDPHYTPRAQNVWIPLMWREMAIAENVYYGGNTTPQEIDFPFGGTIRADKNNTASQDQGLETTGTLRALGEIMVEDSAGGTDGLDRMSFGRTNDVNYLRDRGSDYWRYDSGLGTGSRWFHNGSTFASPLGWLGTFTNPIRNVTTGGLGIRIVDTATTYTLTGADSTVNVTSGSNAITVPLSENQQFTNRGQIYVIKNSGSGTVPITMTATTRSNGTTTGTNSSPNITFSSTSIPPTPGSIVTGTNIPGGTMVLSSTSTSAVLSQNATAPGSGITFTFTDTVGGTAPSSLTAGQSLRIQSTGGLSSGGWISW